MRVGVWHYVMDVFIRFFLVFFLEIGTDTFRFVLFFNLRPMDPIIWK